MQKTNYKNVDEYIASFSEEIQTILQKIRQVIKEVAPDATEVIAYQMPTYKLKKNLVHFAAFKNHIGFYPTPSGVTNFEKEISKYKHAKGSMQFPLDEPIPYKLIEKIVRFRVEEEQSNE